MKRRKQGWHQADIVAAVRKKGKSLVGIAEGLGLTRSVASRALILPHARVNRAIAEVIGEPLHVIWPQWFAVDGERIAGGLTSRSHSVSPTARASESSPAELSSPTKAA